PARQPDRRLGLAAVGDAGRARGLRCARGRGRAPVRGPGRTAAAALDRFPRAPALDRVLARRRVPPARSRAVRARRRRALVEAAAVPVSSGNGPRRIVCLTEEPTEVLY